MSGKCIFKFCFSQSRLGLELFSSCFVLSFFFFFADSCIVSVSVYHSLFLLLSCCSLLMRPVWCRIRRSFASAFFFNYISILLQEICVWLRREKGHFSLILFFYLSPPNQPQSKVTKLKPRDRSVWVQVGFSNRFLFRLPQCFFYIDTCQTHIHLFGINIYNESQSTTFTFVLWLVGLKIQ